MTKIRNFIIGISIGIIILVVASGGAIVDRRFNLSPLDKIFPRLGGSQEFTSQKIVSEESDIIDVVTKVSPSVVTVSAQTPQRRILEFSPFGGFQQSIQGGEPQDIGSGFVVSPDGLIITNKHVVSVTGASYRVITKDNKEYEVKQINRDPSNDIAVLKIEAKDLQPVTFGDSGNIKVGQTAIAMGTPLGEFRGSVTKGVISGLGRGITAGSAFEGYVERLDDVIQTDAAINPGNSGGPLLNSAGEVIGINVAVVQGAQNIGFAIPGNVIKDALNQFKTNGKFAAKPYLGVEYQMINRMDALLNHVPQGALVANVISDSPADKAGVKVEDIITKMDGEELNDANGGLSGVISKKKAGDKVELEIWRNGETIKLSLTLSELNQ
jgi:S1-C subfamily serine protease